MYLITFNNVDKDIIKIDKAFKSKKGHSLLKAEKLLIKLYDSLKVSKKITIVVTDIENELDYIFDDIVIDPSRVKPLMDILEYEIHSSGHDDAQRLVNSLEKSYQTEQNDSSVDKVSRSKSRGKKKGISGLFQNRLSSLSKFSSNKNEVSTSDNLDIIDDFKELDGYESENNQSEEIYDGSGEEEVPEENINVPFQYSENNFEELDSNIDYSEIEETNFHNDFNELNNTNDEQQDMITDDVPLVYEDEENVVDIPSNEKKEIIFPAYDSYLDLSSIDNTVNRFTQRFEKENLIKFLGLNYTSDTSELESLKLKFAMNSLDDPDFVLLKDYFINNLENLKDKVQTKLAQAYETAMLLNYEEEAKKTLEDDIVELSESYEKAFETFLNEQESEYSLKLEKFVYDQEKALEEFKRQQSIEKDAFLKDLETKKSARIGLYREQMQNDLDAKKVRLIEDKTDELKYQSINVLTETKRTTIRNFEDQIDSAMDDVWDKLQKYLVKIRNEIDENINSWKIELEEKRKLEFERREEERRREELEIERQKIELQRKQLERGEITNSGKEKNVEEIIDNKFNQLLVSQLQSSNSVLQQLLGVPVNSEANFHKHDNQEKHDKKQKNILISVVLTAIVVVSCIALGRTFAVEAEPVESQHVAQPTYEDIKKIIDEKLVSETTNNQNQNNLKTLLENKDFAKAMSLYNDKDSLNQIETSLFENADLSTLITFNKTKESQFGILDEAILSRDGQKALDIYNSMSDDDKKVLTKERKSELALLLYQLGENDLAQSLFK